MPVASINERLIHEMAELARLRLSEQETASIARHLARVLEWFEMLDEADTRVVEPTSHPLGRTCPHRPDEAGRPGENEAMAPTPCSGGRFFVVPATTWKKE